jgi:transcriptional regulator with XRE-family HTH domain
MEPSPFCVEFGRRVQRRRCLLGLRQWQIAQYVGVHHSHITQVEGGFYQSMKLEQLTRLVEILETSADYLLQLTPDDPGVIPPRPSPGEARGLRSCTLPLHPIPLSPGETSPASIARVSGECGNGR